MTPFEFIPWILGQCRTVKEARALLERINLVNLSFSDALPLSPLHWIIADKAESVVVESMRDGLHIHNNPAGVLTNNPPFDHHMLNLNHYRYLRADNGDNLFAGTVPLQSFCQGLGAFGLPGDLSSMSRFVRIAFGRANSVCESEEVPSVSQFFHLLSTVEMTRGCCVTEDGHFDITVYTSCMNASRGRYYCTTYENRQIHCVDLHRTDLDGDSISCFPLVTEQEIVY